MAVIGLFGKLQDTVRVQQGTPVHEPFEGDVPVGTTLTTVCTLSNDGPENIYINGLDLSAPSACYVVLRRGVDVLWRGRVGYAVPLIDPRWHNAEFEGEIGEDFVVQVVHWDSGPLTVSGNLMGYKR